MGQSVGNKNKNKKVFNQKKLLKTQCEATIFVLKNSLGFSLMLKIVEAL